MSTKRRVSRRQFLTQSATVGALGCVSGVPAETSAAYQGGDDALVAPHYRGFLKKSITELPTPALLIDLDIFERNLQALASYMKGRPVTFRPHGKAHKSPAIGKLQLSSGAHGLCAAKLGEADVLIRGGITDVLITAEVVGRLKIERLMALLALTPDVKAVVDNEQNVIDLSAAVLAVKGKPRKLKVAIDCNVGQNRTGLGTPAEVVALAQVIARQKGLELIGLQGYGGNNQHVKGFANRRAREVQSNERVVAARQALEAAGFAVQLVSVGGTGSYNIDADFPGCDRDPAGVVRVHGHELQQDRRPRHAGVLRVRQLPVGAHNGHQPRNCRARNRGCRRQGPLDRRSDPRAGGFDRRDVRRRRRRVRGAPAADPSRELKVGDQVQILPGHCDTTVNLHNVYLAVRKGTVEHVWPIEGRGRTD